MGACVSNFRFHAIGLLVCVIVCTHSGNILADEPLKTRSFLFTYAAMVKGLTPLTPVRVWIPVPRSNNDQTVREISRELPASATEAVEPKWGNHIIYFEVPASADGSLPLSVVYRVTRRECGEDAETPEPIADYLKADALVPIGGKPSALLLGREIPADLYERARMLYDLVDEHMQYRKDKPGWGRGDAAWACDSRFGNCVDFHSLFISLARTEGIPSRFEIGFGIPTTLSRGPVPGYHCWAKFKPPHRGWIPVDASEAKKNPDKRDYFFGHLCENRVLFTTGRDLDLVPRQHGPPLNFFIYPYVEVGDEPWPANNIERRFSYQDITDDAAQPLFRTSKSILGAAENE